MVGGDFYGALIFKTHCHRWPAVVLHVVDWITLKSVLLRKSYSVPPYSVSSSETLTQSLSSPNSCKKNSTIYIHNSAKSLLSSNFGKIFLWLPQVLLLLLFLLSSHNGSMMFSWVLEVKTPDSISLITCMQIWFEEVLLPLEMMNHLREGKRLHLNS